MAAVEISIAPIDSEAMVSWYSSGSMTCYHLATIEVYATSVKLPKSRVIPRSECAVENDSILAKVFKLLRHLALGAFGNHSKSFYGQLMIAKNWDAIVAY